MIGDVEPDKYSAWLSDRILLESPLFSTNVAQSPNRPTNPTADIASLRKRIDQELKQLHSYEVLDPLRMKIDREIEQLKAIGAVLEKHICSNFLSP